jgi:hypothetical protein
MIYVLIIIIIVQNLTSNVLKLLYLHSSAINNNLEKTDFLRESNEEFLKGIANMKSKRK